MGKLITGDVSAQAGAATAAINKGVDYFLREVPHLRQRVIGERIETAVLIEYMVEADSQLPPSLNGHVYWGQGMLRAETPFGVHEEKYMFPVPAATLETAWAHFDAAHEESKPAQMASFRERMIALVRQQAASTQPGIQVVQNQAEASRILRPGG